MKKFTLITGATSGIGWELSKVFASKGHNLILTGRDLDRLKIIKSEMSGKIEIHILSGDLSNADFIDELKEYTIKNNIFVQYLVNNAGMGSFGAFIDIDKNKDLLMIDVNVRAVTHLCKLFLPQMIRNNDGGILNVCSTAAFSPGPYMSVYYATKAYVLSLTEGIKGEVKGTNVKISAICPGATKSNFQNRANIKRSGIINPPLMTPTEVALAAYKGFMKKRTVIVPGNGNKVLRFVSNLIPFQLLNTIIRKVNGK